MNTDRRFICKHTAAITKTDKWTTNVHCDIQRKCLTLTHALQQTDSVVTVATTKAAARVKVILKGLVIASIFFPNLDLGASSSPYHSSTTHSLQTTFLWPCVHSVARGERGSHESHSDTSMPLQRCRCGPHCPVSVGLARARHNRLRREQSTQRQDEAQRTEEKRHATSSPSTPGCVRTVLVNLSAAINTLSYNTLEHVGRAT